MAQNVKELSDAIRAFEEKFAEMKVGLIREVNEFVEANPTESAYPFENDLDRLDDLALTRAWVEDRLNKHDGFTGGATYSKSRSKKIRKALGFNV